MATATHATGCGGGFGGLDFKEIVMCYEVILSTTAPFDLAKFDQLDVYFEQTVSEENRIHLKYPHVYRLATYCPNCCSCGFRILDGEQFDYQFVGLQDWMQEEDIDPDIINTRFLFQIIKNLVNQGFAVDTYTISGGDEQFPPEKSLQVSVNTMKKFDFALFEYVYFDYKI